jgi:hypothetical protein
MTNTYTKIFNCLENLTRANDPSKKLPLNTRKLIGFFLAKLQKSTSKVITVDFEVIMKVVETGERQARRILNQIRGTLFHIEYKKAARINNRFVQHKMVISLIDNNILDDLDVRSLFKENNIIINNNRSRANFCKNVDKLENTEPTLPEQQPQLKQKYKQKSEPKILNDFYPLTEELANEIRVEAGRNFSLNAMNEILKDIAKRLTHCIFYSIKGFKAYMVKLLKNEMRDESKVNNETFRITANLTEEEKKAIMIEKYLSQIENNREVSQEMHLKKKLANVLKPETAYELLKNYRDINVKNDIAEITLRNHVELTELEKDIVLSKVKATHETLINVVFTPIATIKYTIADKPITFTARAMNMLPRTGTWGNIRNKIAELLGKDGDAIDTNIFSKLDAEIDEQTKQIKLKAPINHLKVIIEDTYTYEIRSAAESYGFTFKEIYC